MIRDLVSLINRYGAPPPRTPHHPEVQTAVALVRQQKQVGDGWRFPVVTLKEPHKDTVLAYQPGSECDRQAFLVLLNNHTGNTYEAVVSLTQQQVISWTHLPDIQPNIMADELEDCEAAVRAHPDFQAAVARRGLELDQVVVDPWAIGHFGFAEEDGQRLSRCLCYVRTTPESNFYSRAIDGLVPVVDLNTMTVLRIEDVGDVPVPPEPGEYAREFWQDQFRQDLKPLTITQPKAPVSRLRGTKFAGSAGKCASALPPAKGWCSIRWAMKTRGDCGRFSIGPPWPRWWCPMGTRAPSISAKMPLT
jgi:primary-amine oxidase